MTYADLVRKYETWKAKHPHTILREPSPAMFASVGLIADKPGVLEAIGRSMDEIIRTEELVVFQRVPFETAHAQVRREFATP
jgi:hypothetical protein